MEEERARSAGTPGVLATLDDAAARVLEVRALLMSLPPEQREELCTFTDTLLAALGWQIATQLSPPDAARMSGPTFDPLP